MFWRRKPREGAHESVLTLMLIEVRGLHEAADAMAPRAFGALTSGIIDACRGPTSTSGGCLVRSELGWPEAGWLLCAWEDLEGAAIREVAREVLDAIAALGGAEDLEVAAAVHRGTPVLVMTRGGEIEDVLGHAVNHVMRLARGARPATIVGEA